MASFEVIFKSYADLDRSIVEALVRRFCEGPFLKSFLRGSDIEDDLRKRCAQLLYEDLVRSSAGPSITIDLVRFS